MDENTQGTEGHACGCPADCSCDKSTNTCQCGRDDCHCKTESMTADAGSEDMSGDTSGGSDQGMAM